MGIGDIVLCNVYFEVDKVAIKLMALMSSSSILDCHFCFYTTIAIADQIRLCTDMVTFTSVQPHLDVCRMYVYVYAYTITHVQQYGVALVRHHEKEDQRTSKHTCEIYRTSDYLMNNIIESLHLGINNLNLINYVLITWFCLAISFVSAAYNSAKQQGIHGHMMTGLHCFGPTTNVCPKFCVRKTLVC